MSVMNICNKIHVGLHIPQYAIVRDNETAMLQGYLPCICAWISYIYTCAAGATS